MAVTLTLTYKCDSCGQVETYTGVLDLYDDPVIVLPPGWGEYVLPDPNLIENVLDLCPPCMARFRSEGKDVKGGVDSTGLFRWLRLERSTSMSFEKYTLTPNWPPGTTPEQMQAVEEYVRSRMRCLNR